MVELCPKCKKHHDTRPKDCIINVLGYCDVFCGAPPEPHNLGCHFEAMTIYCEVNGWKFGKRLKSK